ncbi:hypothetical protein U14_05370 [Candidatus Moduliflexus flocculans]|uniref:Uncharacterized protein n=1 Tax=Candidatus Moduliflexus flocculans TaxID=1499966 RepID=A0A081BRR2_9BACT|nr:hypothetical protein U14_05370 [Candidatus Moduliflexus flocculans]
MSTVNIRPELHRILQSERINPEIVLREAALLRLLAQREQLRLEISGFEQTYHSDFFTYEQRIHSQKNSEDFAVEEDLMDWEFALKSLEAVNGKLTTLLATS